MRWSVFMWLAGKHGIFWSRGKLQEAVRTADVAVIDTMGASEKLQETVRVALERCEGERIVIGNTLREYLRLGSFSMAAMRKSRKKKEAKTEEGKNRKEMLWIRCIRCAGWR